MFLHSWTGILTASNIAALAVNWALSVWRYLLSPDYIPLHYTVYFGFDRFGPRWDIFLFALLASIILGINFFVLKQVFAKVEFWSVFFLALTLLLQLILLGAPLLVTIKSLT